jgi:G3E family GTPase
VSGIAVDIVTGFLGSGKTTLLRHALASTLAGHRVAVIVNEVGDIGIDGRVISGLQHVESMVELDSGCICCSIDEYRFDLAVQEIVDAADPTLIVIETTGVADPTAILPRIDRAGLGLDAITAVVDAENWRRTARHSAVAAAQVRAADFLVMNKTDLVSGREAAGVRRRLRRLNRRAQIVGCEQGRVDADVLFATGIRRFRSAEPVEAGVAEVAGGKVPVEDAVDAFSYKAEKPLDYGRFEGFLAGLPPQIIRAKGFVRIAGNPWSALFNYTCGRYDLKWVQLGDGAGSSQAVFIGRGTRKIRDRVLARLARCETE